MTAAGMSLPFGRGYALAQMLSGSRQDLVEGGSCPGVRPGTLYPAVSLQLINQATGIP